MSDLETHFLTFTISITGILDWIYLFGNRCYVNKYYRFLTNRGMRNVLVYLFYFSIDMNSFCSREPKCFIAILNRYFIKHNLGSK